MPFKATMFQRLASHFMPIELLTTSSKYNELLEVYLVGGKVQLATRNACYSYEDKYESFAIAFKQLNLKQFNINKVLVLGGGFCSVPQLVLQYHPTAIFDVVEIDAKVIKLAKEYAPKTVIKQCEFICDDAMNFIEDYENTYDLICIDLFIDDKIPDKFCSDIFFRKVKSVNDGKHLVVFSTLNLTRDRYSAFADVFAKTKLIRAGNNLLYIAFA